MSYFANVDTTAIGNITIQNLVPLGVATTGSAVEIGLNQKGTVTVQVIGTYTGNLVPQVTTDGTNWITQQTSLLRMSDGTRQSHIPSGMNGIWQIDITGHMKFRITALAAVSGEASISLRATSGTSQVSLTNASISLSDYVNMLGNLNFSEETTLNSYTQFLYRDDEMWDTVVSGTGASCTWDADYAGVAMTVTNPGEYVIRQTKLSHPYLAAAPHTFDLTTVDISPIVGVIKRYGYGSFTTVAPYVANGDGFFLTTDDTTIYLKVLKNGAEIFSAAQSTWDDPMDGTGRSGLTLLPTAFQALAVEFLFLGGTVVQFAFLIGNLGKVNVHTFYNSNVNSAPFVRCPTQPLYYSIHKNSGGAAPVTTYQICGKVGSKGINLLKKKVRQHRYLTTSSTLVCGTIGVIYVAMSLKLNVRHAIVDLAGWRITAVTNDTFVYTIRKNPVISGTAISYSAIPNAGYAIGMGATAGGTTCTGGTIIVNTEVLATADQVITIDVNNILLQCGESITGVSDEFVLCIEPVTANVSTKHMMTVDTLG